jgi:hypothetical protein
MQVLTTTPSLLSPQVRQTLYPEEEAPVAEAVPGPEPPPTVDAMVKDLRGEVKAISEIVNTLCREVVLLRSNGLVGTPEGWLAPDGTLRGTGEHGARDDADGGVVSVEDARRMRLGIHAEIHAEMVSVEDARRMRLVVEGLDAKLTKKLEQIDERLAKREKVAAIERKGHLPAGKSRPSPLVNERAAAGAASDFQPIAAQSWLAGTTAAGGGAAAGGGGGGRGAGGGGGRGCAESHGAALAAAAAALAVAAPPLRARPRSPADPLHACTRSPATRPPVHFSPELLTSTPSSLPKLLGPPTRGQLLGAPDEHLDHAMSQYSGKSIAGLSA